MNIQTVQLPLTLPSGPECARCIDRLSADLLNLKGVRSASVNAAKITLSYDPDMVSISRIEREAHRLGADIAERIDHQTLELRDMDCPDCAATIEKSVSRLPGVLWAGANFAAAQIHVEFERDKTGIPQIAAAAASHGVRACPLIRAQEAPSFPVQTTWMQRLADHRKLAATILASLFAILGACLGAAGSGTASALPYSAAILIGGWPTLRAAISAIRARVVDMNVLMTLAVMGAAGIGEWLEGAIVVILFNVGALLQAYATERSRRSLRGLMQMSPRTARVIRSGSEIDISPDSVQMGEMVLVRPGERIPLDGDVVRGESAVNEASITGESVPVEKQAGDRLFAGSFNTSGSLTFRVTHKSQDTVLARILHAVEEAQAQHAPIQQLVDRFASRYTPVVVALAVAIAILPPLAQLGWVGIPHAGGASALWGTWFVRSLSLLILACPCALVISTPVALVAALGAASRLGILVKGGAFLEEMSRVRAIVFDKTGTLTEGRFRVEMVEQVEETGSRSSGDREFSGSGAQGSRNEATVVTRGTPNSLPSSHDRILALAAAVETHSEHPLARAIVDCARERGLLLPTADGFVAVHGRGAIATVEARRLLVGSPGFISDLGIPMNGAALLVRDVEKRGLSPVVLAGSQGPLGILGLSDSPRPAAASVVRELRRLGITHQEMLTGDNARVAGTVATQAGLDGFHAGLLPEDKLAKVRELQRTHGTVAMVGDGINDAPALAAANVGIAMGAAGNDTAIETADIALMGDDLSRLPALLRLSRRTRDVIHQNVGLTLITKLALLGAAMIVGIPLWLAVAGDVGVSLLVTCNALRLLR